LDQVIALYFLQQVAVSASRDGVEDKLVVGEGGEHEDFSFEVSALEASADFDAATIPESYIQEDEIRFELGDGFQGLRDCGGFADDFELGASG
jgi:hypothetical protein